MKKNKKNNKRPLWLAIVLFVGLGLQPEQTTAFQGLPKSLPLPLKPHVERLQLGNPVLPPFAHSLFCLRLPQECVVKRMAMRRHLMPFSGMRKTQLETVNDSVNGRIKPYQKSNNVLEASWAIGPSRGDCNDYAVTKRHQLQMLGWPTDALLLAEVVTTWGEHHLVLVVRTDEGDFVLDNLSPSIQRWSHTSYRWIRMQSPKSPKLWWTVKAPVVS